MAALSPVEATAQTVAGCVGIYRDVLRAVYEKANLRVHIEKALEDDVYRYSELPKLKTGSKVASIDKAELARLVQWKITHGKYRPFLPGMVNKNAEAEVKVHTLAAGQVVVKLDKVDKEAREKINLALNEVTKIKGVGPATGTLILSIYNPVIVPFFQDELYHWLLPGKDKLKYDVKEYSQLLEKAFEIMEKLKIKAFELEQAAYVLMHAEMLTKEQLDSVKSGTTVDAEPDERTRHGTPTKAESHNKRSTTDEPARKLKKRKTSVDDNSEKRQSKRLAKSRS